MGGFRFSYQTVAVHCGWQEGDWAKRLKDAAKQTGPSDLNVFHGGSTDELVVLQSPTSSTRVAVKPDRAELKTEYFDEFMVSSEWSKRSDYSRAKVSVLLGLLESAGAKFSFIGLTTVAHWSTKSESPDRLRKAVSDAFPGVSNLSEGEVPYDFSLRASRIVGDEFSNIFLNWYQSRSVTIAVRMPRGAEPQGLSINEWDMPLDDEGLELRFDRNNKHALFGGKREWTREALQQIVERTMTDMQGSFDSVVKALESKLSEVTRA